MQKLRPLTEDQRSLIMNALNRMSRSDRTAAKEGRGDNPSPSIEMLAWTLEVQADNADRLYELIENADSIEVSS